MAVMQRSVAFTLVTLLGLTLATSNHGLLDCANLANLTDSVFSTQNLTESLLSLHHKERRSSHGQLATPFGQKGAEDILRMAALMPAETLHLLRMVTVPLLNTTLTVPGTILESVSNGTLPTIPGNWSAGGVQAQTAWLANMTHRGFAPIQHQFSLASHGLYDATNSSGAVVAVKEKLISPMSTFFKSTMNPTGQAVPNALKPNLFMKHIGSLKQYLSVGAGGLTLDSSISKDSGVATIDASASQSGSAGGDSDAASGSTSASAGSSGSSGSGSSGSGLSGSGSSGSQQSGTNSTSSSEASGSAGSSTSSTTTNSSSSSSTTSVTVESSSVSESGSISSSGPATAPQVGAAPPTSTPKPAEPPTTTEASTTTKASTA